MDLRLIKLEFLLIFIFAFSSAVGDSMLVSAALKVVEVEVGIDL